jgi:gluconolactonase
MNNGTFGIVEGPVWAGDALYLNEMNHKAYNGLGDNVRMSRMLKLDANEQVSIAIADLGGNGLALDGDGNVLAAVHKDGAIRRLALPGGTSSVVAGMYMGSRFNSPNDIAVRSDGNIYFSDPSFQAPSPPPQGATRVYRIAPGGAVSALEGNFNNPNGVTLSLDENFLYVAAGPGRRFPVMADGSLGAGEDFQATTGGDGMVIDCAGNLYVTLADQPNIRVVDPMGASIGMITVPDVQSVTNVAFGGAERKTLYITGMGNNKGLFKLELDIPGRPF